MSETITLSLSGLTCASCAVRASDAVQKVPGVREASVNYATGAATLEMDTAGLPAVLTALQRAGYPAQTQTVELQVQDMSCASCVGRVEAALRAVSGVETATANLAQSTATVEMAQGGTSEDALCRALAQAGYAAEVLRADDATDAQDLHTAEAARLARHTWLAGLLALPVVILEMGGHMIPAWHHMVMSTFGQTGGWAIQAALTTLILMGPGRAFFARGVPALLRGAPDMNSLVALGTGAAYGFSMVALLAPAALPVAARGVYFEAAAVIVALILLGRTFEARAKGRTGAAIRALAELRPDTATRLTDTGAEEDVRVSALTVDDLVRIKPGGALPVDGIVTHGESLVNESMITGEPLPVAKAPGDVVAAGTINGTGALDVRATRVGAHTTLGQIMRMVKEAQASKLPVQALVDRVTLWFVPAVLAIAATTLVTWLILGAPEIALVAAVSVLIIACPCAMGLATPTSIMVATGRAAEQGMLFRQAAALQNLAEIDVVAFDKTGTLTEGAPVLQSSAVADGFEEADVLRAVAAVEARSEHPLASAICAAFDGTLPPVQNFETVTGKGAVGNVEGRQVLVGSAAFLQDHDVTATPFADRASRAAGDGQTVIYAAFDGVLAAMFAVADRVKPESHSAVAALKAQGVEVVMLSGDARATADAVGKSLGIDRVMAGLSPTGKVATLDQLKAEGYRVAFVGDGINDAPALAAADVGLAVGSGTDVAIEAAHVVLATGDMTTVPRSITVARATLRNIRQNLGWAFGYNVLLIPVAAGAAYPLGGWLLSPVLAAAAMALSSVFVVTNALRLRRL